MQKIVGEVLFDDIALITKANNELIDPMGTKNLHDVPEYRFVADVNHRLRTNFCFLSQSGPAAPGKYDGFQCC